MNQVVFSAPVANYQLDPHDAFVDHFQNPDPKDLVADPPAMYSTGFPVWTHGVRRSIRIEYGVTGVCKESWGVSIWNPSTNRPVASILLATDTADAEESKRTSYANVQHLVSYDSPSMVAWVIPFDAKQRAMEVQRCVHDCDSGYPGYTYRPYQPLAYLLMHWPTFGDVSMVIQECSETCSVPHIHMRDGQAVLF